MIIAHASNVTDTATVTSIFEGIKKGIVELRNKKGWPFARVNWDDITRIEDFQAVITFLLQFMFPHRTLYPPHVLTIIQLCFKPLGAMSGLQYLPGSPPSREGLRLPRVAG